MNFQQLSNLQYWTSLFSSPWSIVTNLIDILIVTYILYHFTKAIAGTKIMILVRGVLVFYSSPDSFQYDWFNNYFLVDQSDHHLRGDCSGGYLFTRDSNRFGAIGPGY